MSASALTQRGYSFADVQEVPSSSVELHSIASARRLPDDSTHKKDAD
jgi:hypothetical protein